MFNTEDIYDIVGSRLLKSRGHEFTRELKLKMMGLPGTQAFKVMKAHCALDEPVESLAEESASIYAEELPQRIQMMPGLRELLDELETRNLPKAIATSSHRTHAQQALARFDLETRFEFLLTAGDVENGKPSPDIYILAAQKLDISPANMLVLEDSLIGSTAAVASGAITVAVPGTHGRGQNYNHVDYVVDRLDSDVILMLLNR